MSGQRSQSGDWPSERARLLEGIPFDPDPLDVQPDDLVERRAERPYTGSNAAIMAMFPGARPRRRDRRALVLAAIAAAGLVFLAGAVAGRATATSRPSSGEQVFTAVTIPSEAPRAGDTNLTTGLTNVPGSSSGASLILDPAAPTEPATPPGNVAPDGELVVRDSQKHSDIASVGIRLSGTASWYDDPRKTGLYAAAGPALRVGDWRGRTVTVCGAVCFAVTLGDFCGCPGGRVIDLSSGGFSRLAPLSRGLVSVTVTWPR